MIDLKQLQDGLPGVTPTAAASLAEAAAVCLESQDHQQGQPLEVQGFAERQIPLYWQDVSEEARRTWGDEEEATEDGACGIAVLLIRLLTGHTVVERSRKGRGFDYWLGDEANPESPLEKTARLEVSGIRRGTRSQVRSRANVKERRLARYTSSLRAYIIVVEFSRPLAEVRDL